MNNNSMEKKVTGTVKLLVVAGKANPAPPVGSVLGQKGVNIMDFCKSFNDRTKGMQQDHPLRVSLRVYQDKTFDYDLKGPSASKIISAFFSIKKGSNKPGDVFVAKVKKTELLKLAGDKLADMNTLDPNKALEMLIGTAKSMGIDVVDDEKI